MELNENNGWLSPEVKEELKKTNSENHIAQQQIKNKKHIINKAKYYFSILKNTDLVSLASAGTLFAIFATGICFGGSAICAEISKSAYDEIKNESAVIEKLGDQEEKAREDFLKGVISTDEYFAYMKDITSYENIMKTAENIDDKELEKNIQKTAKSNNVAIGLLAGGSASLTLAAGLGTVVQLFSKRKEEDCIEPEM